MTMRILIADADREVSETIRKFLDTCGYEVEVATDGVSCIEKLRRFSPAVLVLDRGLLWGGAAGVLAWLGMRPLDTGPMVVMTDAEEVRPPEMPNRRVVGYLHKPFEMSSFLRKLAALCPMEV